MGLIKLIKRLFSSCSQDKKLLQNMAELERLKTMNGMDASSKMKYQNDLDEMKRTINQCNRGVYQEWVDRDDNDYDSSSDGEDKRRKESYGDDSNEY